MKTVLLSSIALSLALFACGAPSETDVESTSSDLVAGRAGAVFTLSNDANDNQVLAYRRAADGSLQFAAAYSTTGKGSGDGLGSQGALTLSRDRRWLFAVSAGSNELAVFRVRGDALTLVDAIATGGKRPISVTERYGVVYVLHAGDGANDISGFYQRNDGTLAALPSSKHALSGPTSARRRSRSARAAARSWSRRRRRTGSTNSGSILGRTDPWRSPSTTRAARRRSASTSTIAAR